MTTAIRLGISSCLLGHEVRFDGGHKRNEYVLTTLGKWFDFVPVCPEMEIGLGAPRESLRLVQTGNLQTYAFLFVLGVAVVLWFVLGK